MNKLSPLFRLNRLYLFPLEKLNVLSPFVLLYLGIRTRNCELIDQALQNGANSSILSYYQPFSGNEIWELLFESIANSECVFFEMIANVFSLYFHEIQGGTSLLVEAVKKGVFPIIHCLIEHGARASLQSDVWEKHLDTSPNPMIRKYLTVELLKEQLKVYINEKNTEQASCCTFRFGPTLEERIVAAGALLNVLEDKADPSSLDNFRRPFSSDKKLQKMKEKYEKFVLPTANKQLVSVGMFAHSAQMPKPAIQAPPLKKAEENKQVAFHFFATDPSFKAADVTLPVVFHCA